MSQKASKRDNTPFSIRDNDRTILASLRHEKNVFGQNLKLLDDFFLDSGNKASGFGLLPFLITLQFNDCVNHLTSLLIPSRLHKRNSSDTGKHVLNNTGNEAVDRVGFRWILLRRFCETDFLDLAKQLNAALVQAKKIESEYNLLLLETILEYLDHAERC
jgi:hypothetical protein